MADGDMLESDRRWPKVRCGPGLGLRCCDQAATWMKLSQVMLVNGRLDRGGYGFWRSQFYMAEIEDKKTRCSTESETSATRGSRRPCEINYTYESSLTAGGPRGPEDVVTRSCVFCTMG